MEVHASKPTIGKLVWIRKPGPDLWELAEVLTNADKKGRYILKTLADKGAEHTREVYLENPKVEADMTSLWHIHEPGILINLERRSIKDDAYTFMGPVLVAVNPLKKLHNPKIDYAHENDIRKVATIPHPYAIAENAFQQMAFAVQQARQQKKRASYSHDSSGRSKSKRSKKKASKKQSVTEVEEVVVVNQSIIVGGESGAGKTESSKMVLRHLVARCTGLQRKSSKSSRSSRKGSEGVSIDRRLLDTNPILESFGNSATLRNHNSSRFGKFLKLHFTSDPHEPTRHQIAGASVHSYLLERSRVTWHAPGERGYHVFYQLLKGASRSQRKHFGLLETKPTAYHYLSPRKMNAHDVPPVPKGRPSFARRFSKVAGNATHFAAGFGAKTTDGDGVVPPSHVGETDGEDFDVLVSSLKSVGLTSDQVNQVLEIVAGVLHLGNVELTNKENSTSGDEATVNKDSPAYMHLEVATKLLGVKTSKMRSLLTERTVVAGTERMTAVRSAIHATLARDALSKALYTRLFDWIIGFINASIAAENPGKRGRVPEDNPWIGVLDIFGFESFVRNDLEQLLINYTNEALQHTFNHQVFQSELDLYRREGLVLAAEDQVHKSPVNSLCLELLSSAGGVLDVITGQGQVPQASDAKMLAALNTKFQHKHKHYAKVHPRDAHRCFAVGHYAGAVTYTVGGFLPKNNDSLPGEVHELFSASSNPIVRETFPAPEPSARPGRAGKASVVSRFKVQIGDLTGALDSTKCSFIRCIKPNPQMVRKKDKTGWFDRVYVTAQLKSLSIPQTAQVLRTGLPTRLPYAVLAGTYADTLPRNAVQAWRVLGGSDDKALVAALLWAFGVPRGDYKLGLTRVFFRSGKLGALDALLRSGNEWAKGKGSKEQKRITARIRQYFARRRWRAALAGVQAQRAFLALLEKVSLTTKAAIRLQAWLRGAAVRRGRRERHQGAARIQAAWRGRTARIAYLEQLDAHRSNAAYAKAKAKAKKKERALKKKKEQIEKEHRLKEKRLQYLIHQIVEEEQRQRRSESGDSQSHDPVPQFAEMKGAHAAALVKDTKIKKRSGSRAQENRKSVRQKKLQKELSKLKRDIQRREAEDAEIDVDLERLKEERRKLDYQLFVAYQAQSDPQPARGQQARSHPHPLEDQARQSVRVLAETVRRREARAKLEEEGGLSMEQLSRRASVRELAHSLGDLLRPSQASGCTLSPALRAIQAVGTTEFSAMKLAVRSRINWKSRHFHLDAESRSLVYFAAPGARKPRGRFAFNRPSAERPPRVENVPGPVKGQQYVLELSGGRSAKYPRREDLSLRLGFRTEAERREVSRAVQFVAFGEVVEDVQLRAEELRAAELEGLGRGAPRNAIRKLLRGDREDIRTLEKITNLQREGKINKPAFERLVETLVPRQSRHREDESSSDESEFGTQVSCRNPGCRQLNNTKTGTKCTGCMKELLLEFAEEGEYKVPYAVDVEM